jgi:hypothetical protein
MKRYLIHCQTAWCGCYEDYAAEAENEFDLDDTAEELAYNTFVDYGCEEDMIEDAGFDPDTITDEERESIDEAAYYWYDIEEFEGSEEEWESYKKA